MTSSGLFWDKLLEKDNVKLGNYDMTRQDKKEITFRQVFYGKNLRTNSNYKYARCFRDEFPNVYSLILSYKKGIKKKEERTVLAHKLMALESKLFIEALRRLFEMGYEVVSIHDAIVVLDTKANEECSPDVVKDVLESVCKDEGLACDYSVDEYGEKAMEDFLASEKELRRKGEEHILSIRDKEEFKEFIQDYNEGKSEIIWSKDKKSVTLHPKDIKDLMYKEGA